MGACHNLYPRTYIQKGEFSRGITVNSHLTQLSECAKNEKQIKHKKRFINMIK